jgi:hypothetical protein
VAELVVTRSENADTIVPPFVVGTNDPIVMSSTKIDQSRPMLVEARVTDVDGNVSHCLYDDDPEQEQSALFSVRLPTGTRCTLRGSLLRSDDVALLRTELVSTEPQCAGATLRISGKVVVGGSTVTDSEVATATSVELRLTGVEDITQTVHGATFPSCDCGTQHTMNPK